MDVNQLTIRPAGLADVEQMMRLINKFAEQGLMLPRNLIDIYSSIRDYWVLSDGEHVLGTCALHICWVDLAEVKALTVASELQGRGWGAKLVAAAVAAARELRVTKVFTLTYVPGFFAKQGFKPISKELLPQKVWMECVRCSKFPNCDEQALLLELTEGCGCG